MRVQRRSVVSVALAGVLQALAAFACPLPARAAASAPAASAPAASAPAASAPAASAPAASAPAGGYGSRVLPAIRLPAGATPPMIDGDISDPSWKLAAHASTFLDSANSQVTPDQTDAYLMYDQANIYIAFYCHDSQPAGILARETVRDAEFGNDDYVQFRIDPFMTLKGGDSSFFKVNAIGTQSTQLSGGRAGKIEWQGQWKGAARRVADGWTAEMQIPWAILSYPTTPGPKTMAFQLSRNQARTHIFSYFSDLTPSGFDDRLGRWVGVSPPAQRWKPRISFLPYLLPGLNFQGGHQTVRSGVDVRYQPTSDLTGVATYKPDFSDVEGAVAGIGFSRGERFVPERRPFFLDGGDYLQLGEGYEIGQFFDSVHIGRFDDGLKLYGQLNRSTTIGVLGTNQGRPNDPFGERNVVAQIRRNLGPTSGANLMVIRHQAFADQNSVVVLAPNSRRGKWSVNGQAVATADTASDFATGLGDRRGAGFTGALNFQDTNLFTTVRGLNVGDRFSDRLGFIFPTDYKGFSSFTDWSGQWRKGPWRDFDVSTGPTWDWHQNGAPFRRQDGIYGQVETRSDYRFGMGVSGGKYDHQTDLVYNLNLATGISNRFRHYSLNLSTGKEADKAYSSVGPEFSLRVFKKLDLVLNSFLQNYRGFGQQHVLTFNYELSPTRSWGGRVVLQDADTNWYLAYRNAGHTGTETYLIIGDPNSARFTRQVLLKVVFAL